MPPRFLNVPPRNPYFTGRDEVLKHQHTTLTTDRWALLTQTQAITGLGGIGKTQTALEYAYRYQQDYQTILWAQADTSEALTRACLTLAELLALPEWEAQDQAAIVAALQHWLATHADWLLILDNVEDPALLELVLPAQRSGQVLLTARDPTTGTRARSLPLETLLPEEGALLLLRRAKWLTPEDGLEAAPAEVQAEAKALSETLGGLPLALDQAGAYLEEHGESVAAYQMLFQTYRTRLLNERGRDAVGHVAPVTVTVTLALDLVAQTHPEAAELLYLCAWLAPEGIPEDLFTEGADALPQRLRRVVADPLAWQEVLGALRRSGLLERQPGTKTFSVHRLVQVVLQDGLSAAARKRWAERAVRLVYAIFPDDIKSTDWQRCQQLLPHALACANHIERWHLTSKEAALLLHQAGYSLFERAQYERALLLFQQALAIRKQVFGPDHPAVAASLNNLASLLQQQGKYRDALPLFEQVLAIHERMFGLDHPDVATSLNNLASLYQDQGQYAKALPLLERALAIDTQEYGSNHSAVAIDLSNLATLYDARKEYEKALPLFQRALGIFEQTLEPSNPHLAIILNNLASAYTNLGQYEQALLFYQRALEIHKQAYGLNHPTVAIELNNLAMLHYTCGEHTEALDLFGQALAIFEQTLPEHPNTIETIMSMAGLLHEMGQEEQARTLEEHAKAIRTKGKPAS